MVSKGYQEVFADFQGVFKEFKGVSKEFEGGFPTNFMKNPRGIRVFLKGVSEF